MNDKQLQEAAEKSPIAVPLSVKSGEESDEIDNGLLIGFIKVELNKMDKSNFGQVRKTIIGILNQFAPTKSDEVERLKGLIEKLYKQEIRMWLRSIPKNEFSDESIELQANDAWQQFKSENNL